MRIAVDTGGTFTDFVALIEEEIKIHKIPSTPKDPAKAVLKGLKEIKKEPPSFLFHGTTVGTNAFLTREGAKTFLITTLGFEDILFIGRQNRKELFSFWEQEKKPLLRKTHVKGIAERILAHGEILYPLRKEDIDILKQYILKRNFSSIAISLLHSYANPLHEKKLKKALSSLGIFISLSSEIAPEFREFERTSTTVLNAYLAPVVSKYIRKLKKSLPSTKIFLMQSSGGLMPAEIISKRAVGTLLSGPAAGVMGAWHLAQKLGLSKIITFDMGGTSTDVSLCEDKITYTQNYTLEGYTLLQRMIDIHTIGAGGGSIAYFDAGGALRVGPKSAGADPGPACYGKGGTAPTVTDANLVLGRLLPHRFLDGRVSLKPSQAFKALATLASQKGFSIEELALGIMEIVNTNMEQAIKKVSIERGLDPQDFTLFCFGGAAGLHATSLAYRLRIKQIVIPHLSGVLSALGLLLSRPSFDFSCSIFYEGDKVSKEYIMPVVEEIIQKGKRELPRYGFSSKDFDIEVEIDLRYKGQSHEITIPLKENFKEAFHKVHHRLYGYSLPLNPLEAIALRVRFLGPSFPIKWPKKRGGHLKVIEKSKVILPHGQVISVPIYLWKNLPPEAEISGPAIIVGPYSTVWVEPEWQLFTDSYGNLWLKIKF